jgi:Clostripain family
MGSDKGSKSNSNKWTVMVYMAGDNNLSEEMVYAIKEMYRVGVTENLDVAIQFDPSGVGAPPRRYLISTTPQRQRRLEGKVLSKFDEDGQLEEIGFPIGGASAGEDSASPTVLKDFISAILNDSDRQAEHYMVVLSGHGNGALGDFLIDRTSSKDPKKPPSSSLSIPALGWVFTEVTKNLKRKIDIVGMDSCLMSMAEVCYELRKTVKYLVGSEGYAFATGWPFHRILVTLRQAADKTPVPVKVVQDYINYYKDYEMIGSSTDQSACDLENFDTQLLPAIRNLASRLEAGLTCRAVNDGVLLAHWEAQSYKGEQYVDLYDFCDRLQMRCAREQALLEGFKAADVTLEAVLAQLDAGLVEAANALKKENVKPAWQFLYDRLDAGQKEALDALKSLHEKQDIGKRSDGDRVRKLIYTKAALKKSRLKRVKDLEALLQAESVASAWKLLVEEAQPGQALQAMKHGNNVAQAWESIVNHLKEVCAACDKVKNAIEQGAERAVLKSCYSGPDFQHSHGLSLFFPWSEDPGVLDGYGDLGFAQDTGWAGFLRKYLQTTRRERRHQKAHIGETPLRSGPSVNPLVSILAPLFAPVRSDVTSRGSIFGAGGMKNPPDGFYRDACKGNKL